jgi:ApbE superfamily uncharacterized protein (UPF0280 family)
MGQARTYRKLVRRSDLYSFQVVVKETDVAVQASGQLADITRDSLLRQRRFLEVYIEQHPDFATSLSPWPPVTLAPPIVRDMAHASRLTGIGPMSAVAGAIAEHVGTDLLHHAEEVIIENGGDIFLKVNAPLTVGIYAGPSPLSMRVGIRFSAVGEPFGICTSSGTIGHSMSFGKADAVCAVSRSCTLADAAATAIGNRVSKAADIEKAIQFGKQIEGILGLVIIKNEKIGFWGDLEVVPLDLASPSD